MKCARSTCKQKGSKQNLGYCKAHYRAFLERRARENGWELGLVDSAPAIRHIQKLRAGGMGLPRISELSGLDERHLARLLSGSFIRGFTAKRILDTEYDPYPLAKIPAIGTARRIQALVAMGYPYTVIGDHAGGVTLNSIYMLATGKRKSVTAEVARRIMAVFNRLQLQPAEASYGATMARATAKKHQWHPPFAWDEESIDDPDAEPFSDNSPRASFGERYDEYRELGCVDAEIAVRMGISEKSLERMLIRERKKFIEADLG